MTENAQQTGQQAEAQPFVVQEAEQQQDAPGHSNYERTVGKLQEGLNQRAEQIRNDQSIDSTERRIQMQELWDRAAEGHYRITKGYEEQLAEEVAEAEKKVFHVSPLERDSLRSAYNDVYNTVAPAFDSGDKEGIQYAREELERLAVRAERTGDRPLAKAVFHIATERGIADLRDRYLASSPEKSRAWEKYGEARRKQEHFNDPQERFIGKMTRGWGLIKPPEA